MGPIWGGDTKVHRANMGQIPVFMGSRYQGSQGQHWSKVDGTKMRPRYQGSWPMHGPDTKVCEVQIPRFMGSTWGPDTKNHGVEIPRFLGCSWGPDTRVHGQCMVQTLRFMGPTWGSDTKVQGAQIPRFMVTRYQGLWGQYIKVPGPNMGPMFLGPTYGVDTKVCGKCLVQILRFMGSRYHGAQIPRFMVLRYQGSWGPHGTKLPVANMGPR